MPRDASGNYTLPAGNPVVTGTTVASSWANTTMNDLKAEMQDSLSRSGNGGMLQPLKHADGTVGAPAITFTSAASTGFYRAGAGDVRFALAGVDVFRVFNGQIQLWNVADSVFYPIPSTKTSGAIVETQTLAALQTVVPFTANVAGAALYLNGTSGDRGRLFEGTDYTYDAGTNTVTLATDYPAGTDLAAVYNDESEVAQAATAAAASATAAAASAAAALVSQNAAAASAAAASTSETNAAASEASAAADAASTAADAAATAADVTAAAASAAAALASQNAAASSAAAAAASEGAAAASAAAALASENAAAASAAAALASETAAAASEAQAEAWAESPTAPAGLGSQSAKSWATQAAASAGQANLPTRNCALNQDPISQGTATRTGMSSTTYTGNGGVNPVTTGVDMATGDLGGLVWLKSSSQAFQHGLFDTVRGATKYLESSSTAVEGTLAGTLDSFDSTGFTLGSNGTWNQNTDTFVAWSFQTNQKTSGVTNRNKAYTAHYNADMGFSIVGYEGDGVAGHEIPHFLGAEPELTIWKNRDAIDSWPVVLSDDSFLFLEQTVAAGSNAGFVFSSDAASITGADNVNKAANNYISYHFRSVPGVSKVGKYIGTDAAGNYVDCGFKVGFLLVKKLSAAGNWVLVDAARTADNQLYPNLSIAEAVANEFDFNETGFNVNGTASDTNDLNAEYLFLAFADSGSGSTTYSYPTTDDTLTVNQNTLLSFANGFNSSGEVNTQELVGAGITATLGAGFENKHLWMYKDKAGSYGFSEYRPLEGVTRNDADKWGEVSPVDPSLRTTAKHFGYESATGVASASAETAGFPAWQAFNKIAPNINNSNWAVTTTTNSWLQYKQDEKRVLKSWRLQEIAAGQASTPRRFTIEGSNDGLNWVAIDSTYTASDYSGLGASLWGDLQSTSGNTTAYLYHRINITANNGDATFTQIQNIEFNTVLPSDYYLVNEGQMYNSSDVAIERTYLAEVRTGGSGDVTYLRNLPVAKAKADSGEFQGGLKVHGEIENRGVCTARVNFDGTQNPPLIRDSYNVADVVDLGAGSYRVYFEEPMDNVGYDVGVTANVSGNINLTQGTPTTRQYAAVAVAAWSGSSAASAVFADGEWVMVQVFGGKEIK